jgi:hypothetical protein
MLKKITTKESDIVKPLMEKLELQYKSRKSQGSNMYWMVQLFYLLGLTDVKKDLGF